MKLLFFGVCLCFASTGVNVLAGDDQHNGHYNIFHQRVKKQTEEENNKFVKELTIVALKAMEHFSNYGHKLIRVEEIGNVSRTLDQNTIKVLACRFDDINHRTEINNHPEINVTMNDFTVCDACEVKINSTENNTYSAVQLGCVLHDSSIYIHSPKSSFPGGYQPIDVDNQKIKELAIFSLDSITQQTLSKRSLGFVKVVSAKSQVVAGVNYKINLLVCENDTSKPDNIILDNKQCRSCDITIWEQSWLNKKNVTKVACSEPSELDSFSRVSVAKRDIHEYIRVGTKTNLNYNDKKVQDLVDYALLSVDQQEGSKNSHLLSKIITATKQIISGILYTIELEICEDYLVKNDGKKCRMCSVNAWFQQWESKESTNKINCNEPYITNKNIPNEQISENKDKAEDRFQLMKDFENFIIVHNKMYSSIEEKGRRFRIFAANMKRAKLLQNNEQGTALYGATQFADLTKNEFRKKYLGLNPSLTQYEKKLPMATIPHDVAVPDEFDWRDHNAVTPVKNQGGCGSCWAFSAVANIEGQYALKSGQLMSLSEQELVDCDSLDDGCGGGLMTQAYEAVVKLGGLEFESDYPYEGHEDSKGCQLKESEKKIKISSAVNVSSDEADIAKYLVSHGPLSVGVNANAMQFYMGGVSHPIRVLCSPRSLDHGVAIVGYGVHRTKYTHKNLPYWLIKNSWGPGWGEQGYYLLYRGDGSCGVNQMVSSATI